MRYEWMNNGQPLPAGHRKAGSVGVTIDFEDGRPEPQNVYAESRDAMLEKVLSMYGNTQVTIGRVKAERPAAPAPEKPATPAAPAAPQGMTPDERMQAVADLGDPARAGDAIVKLVKEHTGRDLKAEQAAEDTAAARAAEVTRLSGEVAIFMEANPDYPASVNNARLLRDRAFAIAQGGIVSASHFQQAYEELASTEMFEEVPAVAEIPAATNVEEPSAPQPPRPRASTGMRPSAFRSGASPVPTGPQMTREEAFALADSDDYPQRLKHEPGFRQKVEAALARG